MVQHLALKQHPTMKAGLVIMKMILAVADPRSVMNAAVGELCNRGEKVQRCAGGPSRNGESWRADAYPANSTFW